MSKIYDKIKCKISMVNTSIRACNSLSTNTAPSFSQIFIFVNMKICRKELKVIEIFYANFLCQIDQKWYN